jgi:hypothetical protein
MNAQGRGGPVDRGVSEHVEKAQSPEDPIV